MRFPWVNWDGTMRCFAAETSIQVTPWKWAHLVDWDQRRRDTETLGPWAARCIEAENTGKPKEREARLVGLIMSAGLS